MNTSLRVAVGQIIAVIGLSIFQVKYVLFLIYGQDEIKVRSEVYMWAIVFSIVGLALTWKSRVEVVRQIIPRGYLLLLSVTVILVGSAFLRHSWA